MKPYMSYWSNGYRKTPDQFTINMHKICAYFLKKNFGEVHFITDSKSVSYFENIKYSSINTDLDFLPEEYSPVWSLGKIYSYKLISEKGDPFIHVDYDIILWEGISDFLKKSQAFAQSVEKGVCSWYEIDKFIQNCPNVGLLKDLQSKPEDCFNAGILGGTDLEFLYNYSKSTLDLIFDQKNKDFWINYPNFYSTWQKAAIPEQYYLAVCAKYYNKNIDTLLSRDFNEEEVLRKKYTHIWGAKNDPNLQHKIQLMVDRLGL